GARGTARPAPHEPQTGHRRPPQTNCRQAASGAAGHDAWGPDTPGVDGIAGRQDGPAVHEDEPGFTLDPENGMDKTLAVWRRKIARGRKACAGLPDGMTGA
ncbi:hypothetical protein ABTZ90_17890, partial [Streptomyces cellulosae]